MPVCIQARTQSRETARIEIPMLSPVGRENSKTTTASLFRECPPAQQDFHDCAHTLERVDGPEQIACGKISPYFLKLVQQLLKPKLVRLMNDDEQRLVMLRRTRARFLK